MTMEEEEEEEEEEGLSQCIIVYFYIQRFTTDKCKNTSLSFTKTCMYIHVNRNNHFPCSNCSFVIDVIQYNKFHAEFREDKGQRSIQYKPKLNSPYNPRVRLQIPNSVKIQPPGLDIKQKGSLI